MKQFIILLTLAATFIGILSGPTVASDYETDIVWAQADVSQLEQARDNYLKALNSNNSGLIESAIFNALMLKVKHPEFDISEITATLKDLAVNGSKHTIRYKAYLAVIFIKNRDEFKGAKELAQLMDYKNPDNFFSYLDSKIKSRLLTINR